jgi:fructose transport system permease protein
VLLAKSSGLLFRYQFVGPLVALLLAATVFSVGTTTFLRPSNISLILQQSMVVGTLALGQTLIMLIAGIDLAVGAIMILGTLVAAMYASSGGNVVIALLLLFVTCTTLGTISGLMVARLNLPPFIVTLGLLSAIGAGSRLYSNYQSYPAAPGLLTLPGDGLATGGAVLNLGIGMWVGLTLVAAYVLTQTAVGRHIYAIGDNPEAARLAGINVKRMVVLVYATAGLIYAFAGWISLGRIPIVDTSGYATANLDSITAVVIGGTSLFGGRGSVIGTLFGALIVSVLANGLTQAGIDSNYQQIATGLLVIAAVAVDQIVRRRKR